MSRNVEKSLLDIDFAALTRGPFTPSPAAWEDQVLYFLMLDRFSDGKEKGGYADVSGRPVNTGATPLYRPEDKGRLDYDTWFRAGSGWQGGTIQQVAAEIGCKAEDILNSSPTDMTLNTAYSRGWFAGRTCTVEFNRSHNFPQRMRDLDFWLGVADGSIEQEQVAGTYQGTKP